MKKLLFKLFAPSADTLAQWAANGIQKAVNESEKQTTISKYATLADEVTAIQGKITAWLKDGKIDGKECDEIKAELTPLFQKVLDLAD